MERSSMKTMTLEEFKQLNPCWLNHHDSAIHLNYIGKRQERWNALDILNLPNYEVNIADKLWAVLRPQFLPEKFLHEYACNFAESVLKSCPSPITSELELIKLERKFINDEIDQEDLEVAKRFISDLAYFVYASKSAQIMSMLALSTTHKNARTAATGVVKHSENLAMEMAEWSEDTNDRMTNQRENLDRVRTYQMNLLIDMILEGLRKDEL